MAKLSSDGKYVTVEKGDTLSQIAQDYAGGASNYKQLAAINNISNPNLIYIGQEIYLTSSGSGPSSESTNSNKPTIKQFGLMSNSENTLFATWTWSKSKTASYKVLWTYDTGDDVWFVGNNSEIQVDSDVSSASKQSTYTIPNGAKKVRFKVKPISKTYMKDNTETHHWTAEWSSVKTYTDSTPLTTPGVPNVEIDKYKLTATLDNVPTDITGIQFQIVKNNAASAFKSGKAKVVSRHVSYSCTVDAGAEYKVRCRAYSGKTYSEWSDYSANYSTIPATPSGITTIRASSETAVYLEWATVKSAKTYDIEWTTKKEYFDGSDQVTSVTGIEYNHYEKTGLESGEEYFFRVRAVNDDGASGWSGIKSITIGKAPSAPTTWSSTTTCITGEPLILYWVHNTEDGSSQTYADLELYINGVKETHQIKNTTDEDEKDKTSTYTIDTSVYIEGTQIQWRVRTAGITKKYGDWSIQRTIDIYAPPSLELRVTNSNGSSIDTVTTFPFYVYGLAGPNTQLPIGYHLTVLSNEYYETTDAMGNPKIIKAGDQVYSKYFDITDSLLVEFSAGNIDLENNVEYTVKCVVSMDSGLTSEASVDFTVSWVDVFYSPNAEIGINTENYTAYIRPYCENTVLKYYQVNLKGGVYTISSTLIESVYGEPVIGALTVTGEQVYLGTTADGAEVHYCMVEETTPLNDVLLSVYRREFDGGFVELAKDLDSANNTTVTDPHPALDFARYRIVATSKTTGAVTYYDPPGYPVGGKAVIIQWDEAWSDFDVNEEDAREQPAWSGSLLSLPYNIDVSEDYRVDVSHIRYIGRTHPVSYYGTQLSTSPVWNMEIPKSDKETLYTLRRLSAWMGNVYVREPSGVGYWASISVSFNQKHRGVTIPITINITRVEGGV